MTRTRILLAAFVLLIAYGVWSWFGSEPTITLNVKDVPLSKVIKEFQKQGRIQLVTNLDPATPVTLYFQKTPVIDALETLSVQTDSGWRLTYLAAPKSNQIDALLAAFTNKDTSPPPWNSFQMRGGGGGGWGGGNGDTVTDPRKVAWEVTAIDAKDLSSYFAQIAQKTPASLALAPDWNPAIPKTPAGGLVKKSVPNLISQAGGASREVFLLEGRPDFRGGDDFEGGGPDRGNAAAPAQAGGNGTAPANRGPRPGGAPSLFRNALNREQMNPEWMAARAEAAIKALPAEEQEQARKDMAEMRTFMEEVRNLPAEERRARVEAAMNYPRVAERMDQRTAARESRQSPTQRVQRSKRYVDRKIEAREKAGNPLKAND